MISPDLVLDIHACADSRYINPAVKSGDLRTRLRWTEYLECWRVVHVAPGWQCLYLGFYGVEWSPHA